LKLGLLAAPGIVYPAYSKASDIVTAVRDGCLYALNRKTWEIMTEEQRISNI